MNPQQEKEFDKYLKKYKINCGGIAKRMIWRYFSKIQREDRAKYIKELEEIMGDVEFEMERIGATTIILCKCKGKCESCVEVKKILKEAKSEIRPRVEKLIKALKDE